MSYTIQVDWRDAGEFENLSFNRISESDYLLDTDEFIEWLEENYSDELEEVDEEDMHSFKESKRDEFVASDDYMQMQDSFYPMINFLHILQNEPLDEQLDLLNEYTPNIVAISIDTDSFGATGLGITGAGVDFSDSLELAYYLTDGVSPIKASQKLTLGKEAWNMLKFCRKKAEETGGVCLYDIKKYLQGEEK